ncbi:hypothetical protein EBR43_03120 [bacterium]|nr:hypothetical protein [bacterium]NBW56775.1 hypothetical protein [bacterium]
MTNKISTLCLINLFCSYTIAETKVQWINPPPTEAQQDETLTASWSIEAFEGEYKTFLTLCPYEKGPLCNKNESRQDTMMIDSDESGHYEQNFIFAHNTIEGEYYAVAHALNHNNHFYSAQPFLIHYTGTKRAEKKINDSNNSSDGPIIIIDPYVNRGPWIPDPVPYPYPYYRRDHDYYRHREHHENHEYRKNRKRNEQHEHREREGQHREHREGHKDRGSRRS